MNVEQLLKELLRMKTKRNNICIELGKGYDWILVDSLIAINEKIKQYEQKVNEICGKEIYKSI